jgi:hypothetical protein
MLMDNVLYSYRSVGGQQVTTVFNIVVELMSQHLFLSE